MHIVGITGSLRKASCNTGLLRQVKQVLDAKYPAKFTFDLVVPDLPLYNGDVEASKNIPASVLDFQNRVKKANAFIFATPEYNYSMSAATKNAIDWASRSADGNLLRDKAAAVMGAGGGAGSLRAQEHFRDSAVYVDMHVLNHPHILLKIFDQPSIFDMATGDLKDAASQQQVENFVKSFVAWTERLNRV